MTTTASDALIGSSSGDDDRDGFASLGLDARALEALTVLGYEEPTPVQREAIPPLLAGRDVLGEAPTGTGKTAAFALPIVQRLAGKGTSANAPGSDGSDGRPPRDVQPRAVVLVPTRELAMQVAEAIHRYGQPFGTRVLPIYGGQGYGQQLRGLRRGVDVVVATPGRMVDHLDRGTLVLERIEVVVLDEADEMLDMGFAEDLDRILSAMPSERQTALFSATISPRIAAVARRHLHDPVRVSIAAPRGDRADAAAVRQVAYVVRRPDKPTALGRILDLEDPSSALVFARTREEVEELADRLVAHGHDAAAIHGGMTQEQRDRVMGRFRDRALDVLVATDVAARGLDIEHVSHVVNYDIPSNPDSYVHRIGRTGRAGREGVAITLVEPREHRLLRDIERSTRTKLELGRIPTGADVRERRLELLRATLRETVLEDASDPYRAVVEPLTQEFDLVEIALAAVRLAAEASGRDRDADDADIPEATLFDQPRRDGGPRGTSSRGDAWRRGDSDGGAAFGRGPRERDGAGRRPRDRGDGAGWTRLFVGAGRRAGMRPGDLVGAITHEAGLGGSAVGAIQIADGFSIVEVPEDAADRVVDALRGSTIRGRKVPVRRDRD